jgi:hypothetical protein
MNQGFHCATCGQYHAELPLVLGAPAPAAYEAVPVAERAERCALSSDQCIIDNKHFFVLGRLEIPVLGQSTPFTWLCWVSLSEQNFERACELWHAKGRESEPPYFAWVQSALPYSPSTLSLKANLVTQPLGERPLVVLQQSEHPLVREQEHGMSLARVQQIVENALHAT